MIYLYRHVHLQLCFISRKLNKVFNIQMSLYIFLYTLQTTTFGIYIHCILKNIPSMREKVWLFQHIFLYLDANVIFILYSILFLTLNYICQTVYYKV